MSKQTINIGAAANDGTGDPIRNAFAKTNSNFTELYDRVDTIEAEGVVWNNITGKPDFATVATSGSYDDLINPPTLGTIADQDGYAVPAGGTSGQILSKSSNTDGELEWINPPEGGGGGGLDNVVQDTTPQLGGNLDLNTFTVGPATEADLTKLSEVTATSTELNYTTGVTSPIQTQLDAKVGNAAYDANSILAANTDNTPAALTIDEQRVVGRITGGNITGLTATEVRTLINVEDGATADQTGTEIRDSLSALADPNKLPYTSIGSLDSAGAGVLYQTAIIDAGDLVADRYLKTNVAGASFVTTDEIEATVPLPTMWNLVIGTSGTTYGYRVNAFGAFFPQEAAEDITLDALIAVSPNIVRLRFDNSLGEDTQIPDIDVIRPTIRDINGNTISPVLLWNSNSLQYESSDASTEYTFLSTRAGETVTITNLATEYVIAAMTVGGEVPTTMEVGQTYSVQILVNGGVAPYTYALTGTWPTGLSINSSTGLITGSPTADGSFPSLSVQVTDAASTVATLPTISITVDPAPALAISGTPVTTGTQGTAYTGFTVSATGGTGPYEYELIGTWPANITINSTTGVISGTPGNFGSFTDLSVRVTDAATGSDDLATFTLTIADGNLGTQVSYTSGNGSDPALPAHLVGDWFVAVVARTGSHSGGTVMPTVTSDVNSPWVLWDSIFEGTDRAAAVYTLQCTDTDHTFASSNVSGRRVIRQYRGKEPDVVSLTTQTSGTSITIPGL